MHDLGADAVVQIRVGRQIFAEIRHPAAAAERDHALFDDVFEPVVSFRIGQIDHAAIEFAKLDQIVAARGVFRQIAVFRRLGAEVFITGDVWVDIREELDAFFFPLFDTAIQLWIVVAIPLPVPHHALAKGGHADTGPVLRPNTVHFYACVAHGIQFLLANFRTALNA
ncbi:Uncharacterised protein [Salmonella enterica subsp. enterica serovar Typhimurium str. DT104]|nr:Uncharacterised protein [Salmonella enterica subsp. enterica serovar Typhimurium str. DT104]